MASALKKKVTSKVGAAMAAPYVKYKEAQMRTSDRTTKFLKGYNANAKAGRGNSEQDQARFNMYKNK